MKNRFFSLMILFAFIAVLATSCKKEEVQKIPMTGISLNKTEFIMNVGTFDSLKVSIEPANATNTEVIMTTNNPDVAIVDPAGVIRAVAPGNAIITASTMEGYIDTCYVTVTKWISYTTFNSTLPFNGVSALTIDQDDNIWCCSAQPSANSFGVAEYNGKRWTGYFSNDVISNVQTSKIKLDAQGNVWIAAYGGIYKYDGTTWTNYNSTDYISSTVTALAIDDQNNIWLGSWRTGVTKFDGTNWTNYKTADGLVSDEVLDVVVDAHNNIWVGTNLGVSKFDGTNWTTYTTSNSGLADNSVHSIAIDNQGNIWFGTESGASKFDGTDWTTYDQTNSGLKSSVLIVATGLQNDMWFYTGSLYLTKFDGKKWTVYSNMESQIVYSIGVDSHDNKWLATWGGGVIKLVD